jgi:hypothetical protein
LVQMVQGRRLLPSQVVHPHFELHRFIVAALGSWLGLVLR